MFRTREDKELQRINTQILIEDARRTLGAYSRPRKTREIYRDARGRFACSGARWIGVTGLALGALGALMLFLFPPAALPLFAWGGGQVLFAPIFGVIEKRSLKAVHGKGRTPFTAMHLLLQLVVGVAMVLGSFGLGLLILF